MQAAPLQRAEQPDQAWCPDPEKVGKVLRDAGIVFNGHPRLAPISGGQSNPTFRLHVEPDLDLVLRAKPARAADLLPSAHAIEREFRVMSALGAAGFPVPKVIFCVEDEEVLGRAFYVMRHVDGRIFRDLTLPGLSPEQRDQIYAAAIRTMAALHALDPSTIGLATYGRSEGFLARNLARWTRQYRATQTDDLPAMEHLINALPDLLPAQDENCVIHGDFKLDNLIYHPSEARVAAVLDWELSTLGHPLTDLAYFCAFMQRPAEFGGIAGATDIAGIQGEDELLDIYCRSSGRTAITDWRFHKAFNFFRMAAIVQGIKKRALDGLGTNPRAIEEAKQIGTLAEMGKRALAD